MVLRCMYISAVLTPYLTIQWFITLKFETWINLKIVMLSFRMLSIRKVANGPRISSALLLDQTISKLSFTFNFIYVMLCYVNFV